MKIIKVVYWDFDGVLRPTQRSPRLTPDGFDTTCVAIANAVHASSGALAVISSTWRRDQRCCDMMAANGFSAPLLHGLWATPDDRDGHRDRCDDVDAHMALCARNGYQIAGFAMVDDLYGPAPAHQAAHLVRIDPAVGVTDADAMAIGRALALPVSVDCYAA